MQFTYIMHLNFDVLIYYNICKVLVQLTLFLFVLCTLTSTVLVIHVVSQSALNTLVFGLIYYLFLYHCKLHFTLQ